MFDVFSSYSVTNSGFATICVKQKPNIKCQIFKEPRDLGKYKLSIDYWGNKTLVYDLDFVKYV